MDANIRKLLAGHQTLTTSVVRMSASMCRTSYKRHILFQGPVTGPYKQYPAFSTSFASVSGNVKDLVTIKYSNNQNPTKEADFRDVIVKDVPISQSGQLCLEVKMPRPSAVPEVRTAQFHAH